MKGITPRFVQTAVPLSNDKTETLSLGVFALFAVIGHASLNSGLPGFEFTMGLLTAWSSLGVGTAWWLDTITHSSPVVDVYDTLYDGVMLMVILLILFMGTASIV